MDTHAHPPSSVPVRHRRAVEAEAPSTVTDPRHRRRAPRPRKAGTSSCCRGPDVPVYVAASALLFSLAGAAFCLVVGLSHIRNARGIEEGIRRQQQESAHWTQRPGAKVLPADAPVDAGASEKNSDGYAPDAAAAEEPGAVDPLDVPFAGTPGDVSRPKVDYVKHRYVYPAPMPVPPVVGNSAGGYPALTTLGDLMSNWDQDALDDPPDVITEVLQHFDYTDPAQREAGRRYREKELPFKYVNVPEVLDASSKWKDDDYVQQGFAEGRELKRGSHRRGGGRGGGGRKGRHKASAGVNGHCQVSKSNFFVFFVAPKWKVSVHGPLPTTDNNWDYKKWAADARKADAEQRKPNKHHFYFQAGVSPGERFLEDETKSFVSRDLPGFSQADPTAFCFDPDKSKGIQCRFGERGVTAATHYDAGRNMIAMVLGAKRYILAPPVACKQLGIIPEVKHPGFRHSFLNFARIKHLRDDGTLHPGMTAQEEGQLRDATTSPALETVLKRGEVLYLPSHWFHYIVSLQMSAQCNTRSGRDFTNYAEFGGYNDVDSKCGVKQGIKFN